MHTIIDNPGNGHCGYYAMTIGLIHLIQEEQKTSSSQTLYERWKQASPSDLNPIDNFLNHDLNLSQSNKTYNQSFLDACQKNLRDILFSQYQADFFDKLKALKTAPNESTTLESTQIYMSFFELVGVFILDSAVFNS